MVNFRKQTHQNIFIKIGSFLVLLLSAFMLYIMRDEYVELIESRNEFIFIKVFSILIMAVLIFKSIYLLYFLHLYLKYKPSKVKNDDLLPQCTILVPAYNEGSLVYKTLKSISESDYPSHKLNVIAIDDGSKDDTWYWIRKAEIDIKMNITALQQPRNMGKRQALYRGFNMGECDVFITIDSDSIILKDTLRNLVAPFVKDDNCGAVAGNVKVLNDEVAIIPKMLNVSFAYSFEFIRAAQSMLGSVLCTPGALAAYRKDAVMNCLDSWVNQKFLGVPTDIGEDRAMTNMILKQGYTVKFQQNAVVLTNIPENFNNLRKMFTRWERSNVRENIMLTKFAFKNFRKGSKLGMRLILINQWLKLIFAIPAIVFMLIFLWNSPFLYLTTKLSAILIFSTIPAIYYAVNHCKFNSFYSYSYGLYYTFLLFWITPYALFTANKRGWLTRGL